MMKLIKPSKISGTIKAPPSKSFVIRAIACALLSENSTTIENPSFCDDSIAAMSIINKLGCDILRQRDKITITQTSRDIEHELDCNESGLCIRMFAPILSHFNSEFTLTGSGSLKKRPISMLKEPLRALGVNCETSNGFPPIKISGRITNNSVTIDGSLTSQFLTGLLMILPLNTKDSTIFVKNLKSRPYIEMTIELLKYFGINIENSNYEKFTIKGNQKYNAKNYYVEGDYSGASFLLVAGAIAGKINVTGLNLNSKQADIAILTALLRAGVSVTKDNSSIIVEHNKLKNFEFDATESPDLFPPLAVLATACNGISVIHGADRLKYKESDRALVLKKEFEKVGIKININGDIMEIYGTEITGGTIDSHNDHRIAMAGALLGLISKNGINIINSECVNKSYPEFFEDLEKIRAHSSKE